MLQGRRKVTVALAATAALGSVLAGCGGSSGGSASSSGSGGTSDITVGNWVSVSGTGFAFSAPQAKAGVEAAIASINASGGVNGHKLKLDFCDQKFDPNQEINCARQMVKDKVSAVVAPSTFFGTGSVPIIERAGIPEIAAQGLSPTVEFKCSTCYPLGGAYSWFWGADYALLKAGATKFAVMGVNNAASKGSSELAVDGLKTAGITSVRTVYADTDATDLSAQATQAISGGVDGVIITTSPQLGPKAIGALRAAGYTGKIATITDVVSQQAVQGLGSKAEGLYLSSLVSFPNDTANAGVTQFLADMKKYAAGQPTDTLALEAWAATELFAKAAATTSSYSASSINQAMKNANFSTSQAPVYGGFVVKGVTPPFPDQPSLLHTNAQIGQVVNGQSTAQGDQVDVVKALMTWKSSH
jgi:ABC-type branched-subunit amino acid transport system substrate-binding protein